MDSEALRLWINMVVGRHERWRARQGYQADPLPDPILDSYKFTNVFRVLDYGSQYLLGMLERTEKAQDALFVSALYRYMNRPEPFSYLQDKLGRVPTLDDAELGVVHDVLAGYDADHRPFFGTAYTMFSGGENPGVRRWEWALGLSTAIGATTGFRHVTGEEAQVRALLHHPRTGMFMAQQIVTDFNYSRWHRGDENDYVFPGPGSLRGLADIHPELSEKQRISEFAYLLAELRAILIFDAPEVTLQGRPPSLMDVQNTLCEFSKYQRVRFTGKGRRFVSAHPSWTTYTLPRHWAQTPKEN